MWWKAILEIILVIAVFSISVNFWACVKSRSQLNRVLSDTNKLKQFLELIGHVKIAEESSKIRPVFGSYADNIASLENSHFTSLNLARNILFVVLVVVFALSYLLGIYYFAANVILFALLSGVGLSASAQNNNLAHVHGVILNLYEWNRTDVGGCSDYCARQNPSLKHLYDLVARL